VNDIVLVHDDYEWQLGLVENTAGVEHVRHEGYWVHASF